jgi:Variant SH3 domain
VEDVSLDLSLLGMFASSLHVITNCRVVFACLLDVSFYEAMYPYAATHDGDITLQAGDVIRVLSTNEDGWWHGTVVSSDETGFFPSSYVQPVMRLCRFI